MKAVVTVSLKDGVLDPQGKAVEHALHGLGFSNVAEVRVGKVIRFDIDAPDEGAARAQAEEMGRRLLANTVIERFDVEVRP
ncbi:MAG TPA: phosphoribosylformylglycinamidine synthase subunit PurS [Acetobacteraceae bacterium]|nr:phosphoribosylformylglycinamidine synthase subunit PurS [Acetobacteraceae bacterium]